MRFICFHGAGTNGKVFENQTARLRQALGRDHEFLFINGTVQTDPVPGVETGVGGSFRFYGKDLTQLRATYSGLIKLIKQRGPFDGVMGFSEGGAVAAGLLILDARHAFAHFKCGIFFCAATPLDPKIIFTGESREMDARADGIVIDMPTAHIWSPNDQFHPNMGQALVDLCEGALREEYVHDMGHSIPSSISNASFQETLRVLERTVERARHLGRN